MSAADLNAIITTAHLLSIQDAIKKTVGDASPDERLQNIKDKLLLVTDRLSEIEAKKNLGFPQALRELSIIFYLFSV